MKFGQIYGMGAAIGFTPAQINAMTLWEFSCCVDGWSLSKGIKKAAKPMTDKDYEALVGLQERWNREARNG
jgi:hypothetical protein